MRRGRSTTATPESASVAPPGAPMNEESPEEKGPAVTAITGAVFGEFSEEYDRFRPDYPAEVWDRLGLGEGARVADLGAGTGRASAALAERGCIVTAVEPDDGMAAIARTRSARGSKKFGIVIAPAEATTLGAATQDAVIAAQAYHWFEAAEANREAFRILKDTGFFAVITNDRVVEGTPWLGALEDLIERYNPRHSRDYRSFDVAERMQRGGHFGDVGSAEFTHAFPATVDSVIGQVRTFSYVRNALTPSDLVRLEKELRTMLTEVHGEAPFEIPYVTRVAVARRG